MKTVALLLITAALLIACSPSLSPAAPLAEENSPSQAVPAPLEYSGVGESVLELGPWGGAAVVRIQAEAGAQPFEAALSSGLELQDIAPSVAFGPGGAVDEYRGCDFGPGGKATLQLLGDRSWKVSVLPPSGQYFPTLTIPGTFAGKGSAVVLLEGEKGLVIFAAPELETLNAWGYGPGGGQKLSFDASGDYRGRAVLPEGAGWIIVSATGEWSVEVQSPCCVAPPGIK